MVSRAFLVAMVAAIAGVVASSPAARQPPSGTAMYVVRDDLRLCPSPRCGGYWIAIANGARTRCADGLRHMRCYAASAVDRDGRAVGRLTDGSLVRGALDLRGDDLGEVAVHAAYAPAGSAAVTGGFYRVFDNGIRCIRAPCFSTTARSVNAATRVSVSGIDLRPARASPSALRQAAAALATKDGLYARGRFAAASDGGRVFRVLRLYLRAPLPRA